MPYAEAELGALDAVGVEEAKASIVGIRNLQNFYFFDIIYIENKKGGVDLSDLIMAL